MAKLKNIIKQLSNKDFKALYDSLLESNADKSAYLLKALRERQLSDNRIMEQLGVNANAFYTLRSRLNLKIEEYLMQQLQNPRTDVLRKVANINETLFTKKRTICIATLKKLEKELQDYDLANELTIIYKALKKLHTHSPDYFQYSQLYNRHVAYTLAIDKAEDLLADYFKKFGNYLLTGSEIEKLSLSLLLKEMKNVANLYESHRLYVFQSCMLVFHRLFVEPDENLKEDSESIEDIFDRVQKIFDTYNLDSLYYHLNLVFEFLKLEYYNHYRVYRQVERYFEEVNDAAGNLMTNYVTYTFPARFLITKLERHLRLGTENELYDEIPNIFPDYEPDPEDVPRHIIYVMFKVLAAYYAGKYAEAIRLINGMLNEISLKRYPHTALEVKTILALLYVLEREFELFKPLYYSVQRQYRALEKPEAKNIFYWLRILKISTSEAKREKAQKIQAVIPKLKQCNNTYFSPTMLIKTDEALIKKLAEFER
ncbi:MAG: hypothetical protein N2044_10355 [Cyclobacteriaceae bacterium]|nr:hypothetical protein [Cyclobacteriaceae bacterium]MCX7638231.1 hypothetical protein [Cyclobacteriaceae bacterium]MDW8331721.1 hypothetical protein [Cyclobacteriaceae bacterium]